MASIKAIKDIEQRTTDKLLKTINHYIDELAGAVRETENPLFLSQLAQRIQAAGEIKARIEKTRRRK